MADPKPNKLWLSRRTLLNGSSASIAFGLVGCRMPVRPLRGPDNWVRFTAIRPDDFACFEIGFKNFKRAGRRYLKCTPSSRIELLLPPQHQLEEALPFTAACEGVLDGWSSRSVPLRRWTSDPTRLVFKPGVEVFPFTLADVLSTCEQGQLLSSKDENPATRIEVPSGLILRMGDRTWELCPFVPAGPRVPLWTASPTRRGGVWFDRPDRRFDTEVLPDCADQLVKPTQGCEESVAEQCVPLVESDLKLIAKTFGPTATVTPAVLRFSSVGAFVDLDARTGSGELKRWIQRTTMGRDQEVEVVKRGFLFPFGNRASLVTRTQRRIVRDQEGRGWAFLERQEFIEVAQPTVTYVDPLKDAGKGPERATCFRGCTISAQPTPALDMKDWVHEFAPASRLFERVRWIRVGGRHHPFAVALQDADKTVHTTTSSVLFIKADANEAALLPELEDWYNSQGPELREIDFHGQDVAFAPAPDEESLALPTFAVLLGAQSRRASATPYQPVAVFSPKVDRAQVKLAAAEALVGDNKQTKLWAPELKRAAQTVSGTVDSVLRLRDNLLDALKRLGLESTADAKALKAELDSGIGAAKKWAKSLQESSLGDLHLHDPPEFLATPAVAKTRELHDRLMADWSLIVANVDASIGWYQQGLHRIESLGKAGLAPTREMARNLVQDDAIRLHEAWSKFDDGKVQDLLATLATARSSLTEGVIKLKSSIEDTEILDGINELVIATGSHWDAVTTLIERSLTAQKVADEIYKAALSVLPIPNPSQVSELLQQAESEVRAVEKAAAGVVGESNTTVRRVVGDLKELLPRLVGKGATALEAELNRLGPLTAAAQRAAGELRRLSDYAEEFRQVRPDRVSIEIAKKWVADATNEKNLWAKLVDVLELPFNPERTASLATPDLSIRGLSRTHGPLSWNAPRGFKGDIEDALASAGFDPSTYFGDAKLLGVVGLKAVLNAVGITAHPKIVTRRSPQQIDVKYDWAVSGRALKAAGPFVPDSDTAAIEVRVSSTIPLRGGPPNVKAETTLSNFALELFGLVRVNFNRIHVDFDASSSPLVIADLSSVKFLGVLDFFQQLTKPLEGILGKGPFVDLAPPTLSVGTDISVPNIGLGALSITGIRLRTALTLGFDGRAPTVDIAFGRREDPFAIAVALLGGGGFLALELAPDGMRRLEAALEFGAKIDVTFGAAQGGAYAMGGIYASLSKGRSELAAYFRLGGYLDVLGIVSVSISLYIKLSHISTGRESYLEGSATLAIDIKIVFFSFSIRHTVTHRFGDRSQRGQALGPRRRTSHPTFAQFEAYRGAYA